MRFSTALTLVQSVSQNFNEVIRLIKFSIEFGE